MTKFKIILVVSIGVVGVLASLMIHHATQVKFREGEALIQQQSNQLAEIKSEHQRLSNLIAHATSPSADRTAELAKLRNQAATLRKQTNELGRQLRQSSRSLPSPIQESHPPEYYEQLNQMAGAKPIDARNLASAFTEYASDHYGQFPSNFDQINSYLAKDPNLTLSGTNQFEIIYQGSLDKLSGIPIGEVAVVRDQHVWLTPDGKRKARVYGMTGGIGQVVESDDDFKSWEEKHIISPR